jgi:hypothetical protein
MSILDDLLEPTDIIDCMIELHHLKERAKFKSDESLVKHIVDFDAGLEMTGDTDDAIKYYFNCGVLPPFQRERLENYYVLLENNLCWGEPSDEEYEEGTRPGVFHTLVRPH